MGKKDIIKKMAEDLKKELFGEEETAAPPTPAPPPLPPGTGLPAGPAGTTPPAPGTGLPAGPPGTGLPAGPPGTTPPAPGTGLPAGPPGLPAGPPGTTGQGGLASLTKEVEEEQRRRGLRPDDNTDSKTPVWRPPLPGPPGAGVPGAPGYARIEDLLNKIKSNPNLFENIMLSNPDRLKKVIALDLLGMLFENNDFINDPGKILTGILNGGIATNLQKTYLERQLSQRTDVIRDYLCDLFNTDAAGLYEKLGRITKEDLVQGVINDELEYFQGLMTSPTIVNLIESFNVKKVKEKADKDDVTTVVKSCCIEVYERLTDDIKAILKKNNFALTNDEIKELRRNNYGSITAQDGSVVDVTAIINEYIQNKVKPKI